MRCAKAVFGRKFIDVKDSFFTKEKQCPTTDVTMRGMSSSEGS